MSTQLEIYRSDPYRVLVSPVSEAISDIEEIWSVAGTFAPPNSKLNNYYLTNPDGSSFVFLLEHIPEKKTVGIIFGAPRTFLCEFQNPVRAAVLADFYVLSSHRSLGPSLILLKASKDFLLTKVDFIYGFMNPASTLIGKRAGLAFRAPAQELVFPIQFQAYVTQRISGKAGRWMGAFSQFLAHSFIRAVAWPFSLIYRFSNHANSPQGFLPIDQIKRHPATLVGQRNHQFIQWKFGAPHNNSSYGYYCRSRTNKPIGYLMYRLVESRLTILDIYSETKLSFLALCIHAIRQNLNTGCSAIAYTLLVESGDRNLLTKLGFQNRKDHSVFCQWKPEGNEGLKNLPIHLTTADNDV